MTTMVTEMHDALLSAGAPEEKARAAASVVSGSEQAASKSGLVEFRADMNVFRAEMKAELATKANGTDVAVLKRGAALGLAMLASPVATAFF
jgi:hypothetical protein